MAKYYTTEWSNRIAYDAIQVHGGNGFMREYPVERLYRDARITNIYEGTSQIQIIWAISRLVRGDMDELLQKLADQPVADPELNALADQARAAFQTFTEVIAFLQDKDTDYREWVAKHVVDIAIDTYLSFLLIQQAGKWDYKRSVANKFVRDSMPRIAMNRAYAFSAQPLPAAT